MLEFVHFTGDATGKDLQTRRKVRSQAMRDFRRRQRAERDAAINVVAGKSPSAPVFDPPSPRLQTRERSASDGLPLRKRGTREFNDTYDRDTRASSTSGGQPAFSVLPLLSPPLVNNGPSSPRRSSHVSRRATVTRIGRTQSDGSFAVPAFSRTPSPSSDLQLSSVRLEDPFKSPVQIAQMFNFCRSYMKWLHPGIDSETAGKLMNDAWNYSRDPMLLAACCLASAGHLDAVQPNRPSGDYTTYRARVLKDLSERMRVPSTATSDETVGTLACLLSFEMSKGNSTATMHLRGLGSIVNAKGGVNSLGFDGNLSMMVECLDLLHACLFDTTPILTLADPGSRGSSPEVAQSDADLFDRLTPILAAEQQDLQQGYPTAYSIKLQELSVLLANASSALRGASLPTGAQEFLLFSEDPAARFRDGLDRFGQQSIRGLTESDDSHQLARACHLTMVLLYNLATNKIPYRHISNQRNCQWLCDAIRNINDSTWQLLPYCRLWVLLTGIVTSTNQTEKGFFKAHIIRATFQMGMPEWRRAKHFILRFLELKKSLERPSRRATPPYEEPMLDLTMAKGQMYPAWIVNEADGGQQSVYSSISSTGTRTSTNIAFGSPFVSRAPSPLSFAESAPVDVPSLSHRGTPFDDTNVDPFLKISTAGSEETILPIRSNMDGTWQQYNPPFEQSNHALVPSDSAADIWFLDSHT